MIPNLAGRIVAIVATGPSAKSAALESLRGAAWVFAVKEAAVDLVPWADAAYGCDAPWWIFRHGLPEFAGLKFAWEARACDLYPDLIRVNISDAYSDRILLDELLTIGAGGNSGFQAVNLALQFGARRIMLIGMDMAGQHYYGRNTWRRANNPDLDSFGRWVKAYNGNLPLLKEIGAEIVNCSPSSALECFPKLSIKEALARWTPTPSMSDMIHERALLS